MFVERIPPLSPAITDNFDRRFTGEMTEVDNLILLMLKDSCSTALWVL